MGDVYLVEGYPVSGMLAYGVAFRAEYPCWWLEMDDGDLFPWLGEMPFHSIQLVKRNELPSRERKGGDKVNNPSGEEHVIVARPHVTVESIDREHTCDICARDLDIGTDPYRVGAGARTFNLCDRCMDGVALLLVAAGVEVRGYTAYAASPSGSPVRRGWRT